MASIKPTTVPSKRLSESITAAASSFKLNNILGWDAADLSSADFGTVAYAVFRNSAGTLMELMEIDPTTIVSASSAITINKRGLAFNGAYAAEVTANKLSWVKGDTIVELGTHVPQLLAHYVDVLADQTIAGVKTFTSIPASSGTPLNTTDLVTKAYADALVLGVLTTIDVVVPGVADATITAGQIVYLKTANGRWALASAASSATSENVLLGIAQGAGSSGVAITGGVLLQGSDANQSALVAGNLQYLSDTPGAMATSHGTKTIVLGIAKDTTHVNFVPRFDQGLTQDQIDALAGTSGTPSATNKFVTNADTSGTGAVVRASSLHTNFGGDGSDGALAISSGTTTIDLGGAAFFEKNYSSISITGTAALAFSNPAAAGTVIVLRSTGDVTITTSATRAIDLRALGGAAGNAGNAGVNTDGTDGTDGTTTVPYLDFIGSAPTNKGAKGLKGVKTGGDNVPIVGGTGGTAVTLGYKLNTTNLARAALSMILAGLAGAGGGGGGGGGGSTDTGGGGGAGGRGAGSLLIECAGSLNFTGTIDASGAAGTAASAGSGTAANRSGGGGGGGGAGGVICLLYKTLVANSGTLTVTGGNGANGTAGLVTSGGNTKGASGGAGGAGLYAGGAGGSGGADSGHPSTDGGAGSGTGGGSAGTAGTGNTGTVGVNATCGGGGGGGGGAAGLGVVASI